MSCQNCYNGCVETVSDQCVKYTGIDIPTLGIQTGDSLSHIEQAITTYLVSALNGTGIKINLTGITICTLVSSFLPISGDITIVDISKALIQAACDLQEQVDAIVADIVVIDGKIDVIEADYTVKCLIDATPSITPSSGTHDMLQATIDTLCALALYLDTNYVRYDELDSLINTYLSVTSGITTNYYNRMVPKVVEKLYDTLAGKFDIDGVGYGVWQKIYVCNGVAGTPVIPNPVGSGYYYIQYRP
jgi:hypothetical protein